MTEKLFNLKAENNEDLNLTTGIAKESDWEDYKKIRLEAIEKEPVAFFVTEKSKEKENNKSEEDWKKDLVGENSFVVLTKNKDIPIGMAHAIFSINFGNQWVARSVYLNKDYRGSGSSKKIMNLISDEIKRRGGKEVALNVADTQEAAKKLYESLDFKVVEKFEPQEEDGIMWPGGCWMKKEL